MMSGLVQRRRGNVASESELNTDSSPQTDLSKSVKKPSLSLHSLYSNTGGNRIAYDPNEVIQEGEEEKIRLTLMEEVLLLGLKDKQGYLSFWNDSLSYVLRGCIIIELSLRSRIGILSNPTRKRLPLSERPIEVTNDRQTGEVLLDEALRLIKQTQDGTISTAGQSSITSNSTSSSTSSQGGDKWSVGTWIDLLSGETWNIMRISYQLRQVRERLAKGLVDKGVLRTEKRNFLLFDMATHPVADLSVKTEIIQRVIQCLSTPSTSSAFKQVPLRTIALVCAAYAANVLENALAGLSNDMREQCWNRADELLLAFSRWDDSLVGNAMDTSNGIPSTEVVASVLSVFSKMDSLL